MSISEGLNAGTFGAEMSSNQFGTDGRSLQLDETLLEGNNVNKVLGTSLVDGLKNTFYLTLKALLVLKIRLGR